MNVKTIPLTRQRLRDFVSFQDFVSFRDCKILLQCCTGVLYSSAYTQGSELSDPIQAQRCYDSRPPHYVSTPCRQWEYLQYLGCQIWLGALNEPITTPCFKLDNTTHVWFEGDGSSVYINTSGVKTNKNKIQASVDTSTSSDSLRAREYLFPSWNSLIQVWRDY